MFRQCTQASQESLAEYHVRLRTLAEKCDFGDRVDFEIKLQIVTNGTSTHLRKKALRDPDFTLKQMLEEGQRVEASTQQTTEIENTSCASVDHVNLVKGKKQTAHKKCKNCGGAYPHLSNCPAQGKKCYKCGKTNHFAKFCMSNSSYETDKPSQIRKFRPKQVRQVTKEESSSDSEDNVLPGREEEEEEESSAVEVESGDAEDERYIAEPFPVILPEDAETEEDEAVRRYPVRRRNRTQLFGPAIYSVL
eukprot:gene16635-18325_t